MPPTPVPVWEPLSSHDFVFIPSLLLDERHFAMNCREEGDGAELIRGRLIASSSTGLLEAGSRLLCESFSSSLRVWDRKGDRERAHGVPRTRKRARAPHSLARGNDPTVHDLRLWRRQPVR